MSRKKKNISTNEYLDDFELDDNGFIEGELDTSNAIASFSFCMDSNQANKNEKPGQSPLPPEPLNTVAVKDTSSSNSQRGMTPSIDGEHFTVKRCYQFRPSTLRKLNEIKAKNPDFNIYLNTILDTAILRYYDFIFNGTGSE